MSIQEKTPTSSLWEMILPGLLCGAFLFAYAGVLSGLVTVWANSEEYSHGFFIIPIAIYICWQKKERLSQVEVQPSKIGLVCFLCSLLLYIGAKYAGILTLVSLSMVFCLSSIVLYLVGWRMLCELAFPLFLLLLMIPIPSQFFSMATIPLQLFVSQVSVMVTSFFGVPVFREGNVIHLPEQTLEVVQACSGLRSLITLLTLGVIISYFSLKSNLLRVLLVVAAVPVAIFVNIVRVMVMIWAFYYFDIDLTADSVHTIYGLVIFMLAMAILIGLKGVLAFWDSSEKQE